MTGVLVVDDSSFARLSIIKQLSKDPDIKILDYAKDGLEAVKKAKELKPDVITLDVQMPKMNGLEALEHIMSEIPTPVVMLSSLTDEGTDTTIKALEMGAIDFYLKSSATITSRINSQDETLVNKVKLAAIVGKKVRKRLPGILHSIKQSEAAIHNTPNRPLTARSKVVVIGSSTGGPGALYEVVPKIPADLSAGIVIVQHMPATFTRSLASRLNDISKIKVKEAEPGDIIYEGQAYIAPGNFHMTVAKGDIIQTNQQPQIMGLRPAANITMESVAAQYGSSTIGVILTGMGSDGTEGAKHIKKVGGTIAVQNEETCVIYGMPKSVVDAGYADRIIPLQNIAEEIVSMCNQ